MKDSKFRLAFIPAMEISNDVFYEEAETYEQAQLMISAIANCILFMHENGSMQDFSNLAWVEVFENNEWLEHDCPDEVN
jgi:hypothetical protein